MSRRFVVGAGALLLTGGISFFAGRMSTIPEPPPISSARPVPSASAAQQPQAPAFPPLNSFPEVSFAQQGEDLIIKNLFGELGISEATYLDIGAHDPIHGSNSYLFYALGSHGVLVEPNPEYVVKLKKARPRDVVIDKGIGIDSRRSASYYDFGGDGQDNTFSQEQVARLAALGTKPIHVIDLPLVDINDVLAANFPTAPPSLLSIDTEGLDLAILKRLDFKRFRPPVICAETLEVGTSHVIEEIAAFLRAHEYTIRGETFVNTIFVANEALAHAREASDAGARDAH